MDKYKVTRGGYSYGSSPLLIGQVFEGADKGQKFLDQPAITLSYMGKDVNVPTTYLEKTDANAPVTNMAGIIKYANNRKAVKSAFRVAGLGGMLFLAYKTKQSTWGYIGFGLIGLIGGSMIGGQTANIILKHPQQA